MPPEYKQRNLSWMSSFRRFQRLERQDQISPRLAKCFTNCRYSTDKRWGHAQMAALDKNQIFSFLKEIPGRTPCGKSAVILTSNNTNLQSSSLKFDTMKVFGICVLKNGKIINSKLEIMDFWGQNIVWSQSTISLSLWYYPLFPWHTDISPRQLRIFWYPSQESVRALARTSILRQLRALGVPMGDLKDACGQSITKLRDLYRLLDLRTYISLWSQVWCRIVWR